MQKPENFMGLSTEEIRPYWPTLSENDRMKWAVSAALKELIHTDPEFRKTISHKIAEDISGKATAF